MYFFEVFIFLTHDLTHSLPHLRLDDAGRIRRFGCFRYSFISMKWPIFSAASSCIFVVTWV